MSRKTIEILDPEDGYKSGRIVFDGTTLTIETDCHGCYAETSNPELIAELKELLWPVCGNVPQPAPLHVERAVSCVERGEHRWHRDGGVHWSENVVWYDGDDAMEESR